MKKANLDDLLRELLAAPAARRNLALDVLRGGAAPTPAKSPEPLFLGMAQAARCLGISRSTFWLLVKAGRIRKVEIMPGLFRIRRSDLESFGAAAAQPDFVPASGTDSTRPVNPPEKGA